MIEDELRAAFARHEDLAPAVAPVSEAIEAGYRRRRRERLGLRAGSAAAAAVAVVAVPAVVVALHRPSAGPSAPPLAGGTASVATKSADAATGRPLTLVVALMDQSGGGPLVAAGIVQVPASDDRVYVIALTGDDAAAVGNEFHDRTVGRVNEAVTRATGVTPDGVALLTVTGVSTVVSSLGGIDACPRGGGCQHLTGESWLPYLKANAATGGFASVGTGVLMGLSAITDPARLSRVLANSGTVSLTMSADLTSPGDLSRVLSGIRGATGIVEPAGAERTELFQDLKAGRLDAYLAVHPS